MNQRGLTLIEGLIALGLLSIALISLLPTFQTLIDANTFSEERSNSLAAAQEVMEALRHQDPASLPDSGSSGIQVVTIGNQEYEVVTHFCQRDEYCGPDVRHIVVEVSYAGKVVYAIETVFTRLR